VVGNRSFDTTNTTSNPLKFAFRRRNICLSAISRSCCISVDTAQSSVLIVGNFVPLMSVPSLPQAVDLRPQLVNRPGGQQAQSIPETTQALCDDPLRRRVSAALLAAELRFYALGQVSGGHCEGHGCVFPSGSIQHGNPNYYSGGFDRPAGGRFDKPAVRKLAWLSLSASPSSRNGL